jgi:hypothetical protein
MVRFQMFVDEAATALNASAHAHTPFNRTKFAQVGVVTNSK